MDMNIREKLTVNRLKLAIKPVDLGLVFPVTFDWRIGAILEKSKWKEANRLPITSTEIAWRYYDSVWLATRCLGTSRWRA